jgi:hypothetical protein
MLLGVTLSEKRSEADAIIVYERAKHLLQGGITELDEEIEMLERQAVKADEDKIKRKKAAKIAAKKILFQAQLFQANAYRKLYRWDDLMRAITNLDKVDKALDDIEKTPLPESSDRDKMEFRKIRTVALSEQANSIGYGLILLYPQTFIAVLKDKVPGAIALADGLRQELDQIANLPANAPDFITRRNKAFGLVLDHLYVKQQSVLEQAHKKMKEITQSVMQSGSKDDDAWKRERHRIASLRLSADGYARFRHAQGPDEQGKVRGTRISPNSAAPLLINLRRPMPDNPISTSCFRTSA